MFNKVILTGNMTRDVELRYLPNGSAVGKFGIATNRKWKDQNGEKQEEVMFIDVTVFGKGAETIQQYTSKGDTLLIEGYLKLEQWESNGAKHSKHTVMCESFQFIKTKKSNEDNSNNSYQKPPQQKPQSQEGVYNQKTKQQAPQQQQEVPVIDIDDEDIPF